jgi:erythromycin esterase-like protein
MAETLDALTASISSQKDGTKIVVWAHNSHLGDARATEMATRGELNVGQLVRTRHGANAVLIGFTTYGGTVTAANDWDGPAERRVVRPARPDSYEAVMHDTGHERFFLNLRSNSPLIQALDAPRLERAIGVIYKPETERQSHYFTAQLPRQFDALFHYDVTRAVEPLERTGIWDRGELPETFPSAL